MTTRRTITIAANGIYALALSGKYFTAISATAIFNLTLDNQRSNPMSAGESLGPEPFKRVTLTETSGAPNTISFVISDDPYRIATPVANGGVITTQIGATTMSSAQFLKVQNAPGTPVQLGNSLFMIATIIAVKSLAGGANAGNVMIGPSSAANQQPFILAPGDQVVLAAPALRQRNFADWYLDAVNPGDGVVVMWS